MISYENYLEGKTVAMVASGGSLKGKGLGKLIDSYDIVVRLNRALPLDSSKAEDVGERTDVLYNTLDAWPDAGGPIDGPLWKKCGVKYVCSTYPKSEYFTYPERSQGLDDIIPTRWVGDSLYYPIKEQVVGRPNSGTIALVDLLSFKLKEVRLFGLDFFRTLYDTGYLKEGGNVQDFERLLATNPDRHDPDSQYLFFKNVLYANDDRIKIDDYFEQILNDPSYDTMYFKGE